MERKTKWIGCGLIALWTLAPMISVLVASAIASAFDCSLNEGGVNPCVVLGTDIGELLYTMFVMGWFFFITVPTGLVAAVIFLVIMALSKRRKGRLEA